MNEQELHAWYVDRGDFVTELEDGSAMLRLPRSRDNPAGKFYGYASLTGEAMTAEVLDAFGVESQSAGAGWGVHFRGGATAVQELLLHTADVKLHMLIFHAGMEPPAPVGQLSFAHRSAELLALRWSLASGQPENAAQRERFMALNRLPHACAPAGVRPDDDRTQLGMRCASCGWTDPGTSLCGCGGRLFPVSDRPGKSSPEDLDSSPW